MTQTARLYGSSLYELAAEEQLTDVLMEQMEEVRQLFRENPEYEAAGRAFHSRRKKRRAS